MSPYLRISVSPHRSRDAIALPHVTCEVTRDLSASCYSTHSRPGRPGGDHQCQASQTSLAVVPTAKSSPSNRIPGRRSAYRHGQRATEGLSTTTRDLGQYRTSPSRKARDLCQYRLGKEARGLGQYRTWHSERVGSYLDEDRVTCEERARRLGSSIRGVSTGRCVSSAYDDRLYALGQSESCFQYKTRRLRQSCVPTT
eukprot:299518-Rhodomonas_salina.5